MKKTPPKSKKESEKEESTTAKQNSAKKPGSKYYAAYMRREGPQNPGSKRIPVGNKDCFAGLKFLITGVLDSLERDECKSIIEKYGGHVVSGVTKKLDYLIVGKDAGESKLQKADELNVKKLDEDEFLQLICTKSGIKAPRYEGEDIEMTEGELINDKKGLIEEKQKKEIDSKVYQFYGY